MLLSFISISNPSADAFVSSSALLSKLSSAANPAKSIPEIDIQLYSKYGLTPNEIAFIESKVKPME